MPEALAFIPALFEALGSAGAGIGGALGIGEAAAAPLEAGAIALPEIAVTAPAAGAAFGAGDAAAGIGLGTAAAAGGADALAGGALAGGLTTNDIVGGAFDVVNGPQGIAGGTIQPTGTIPNSFAAPAAAGTPLDAFGSISGPTPGGGVGAAGLAPPSGVSAGTDFASIGPGSTDALTNIAQGTGAGTGASTGGVGDLLKGLGTGALDQLKKNPLSIALAAPLLKQLISPPKLPQSDALNNLVSAEQGFQSQQNQLGKTLTDPLVTGQLPSGAEQSVQNAIQDAITTTKARYANLGLSGSTAETDAIANIENQATGIRFNIAEQMAQTGLNATSQAASTFGLQDQIYSQLMQAQLGQDQALSASLAKFAAAASTTPQAGVNLRLG